LPWYYYGSGCVQALVHPNGTITIFCFLFFACHVRSSNMADEHVFLLAKGGMLHNQLPEEDI